MTSGRSIFAGAAALGAACLQVGALVARAQTSPAQAQPTPPATAASPAGTAVAATTTPPAAAWKPFQEFAFLTGSWAGGATVGARFGGRVARFDPQYGGNFFVLHASTILAAEEGGRPEETLEETGWFAYDREKRKYTATWFFSNGVMAVLDVELLPDGLRLVSREVVNYEAGTRARILFQRRAEGDVAMNVDLASPGKDFVAWLVSDLRKK